MSQALRWDSRRWVVGLVVMGSLCVGVSAAQAQESIFDPENPGAAEESEEEPESSPEEEDEEEERPQYRGATEWDVTYDMGLRFSPDTQRGRDEQEVVGQLGLALRHDISPRSRAVLRGHFNYWAASGRQNQEWRAFYEPRLDRAYVVHRRDEWSFRAGQQRTSWGSTDIIRPGDMIDPRDLRDPAGGAGLGSGLGQLSGVATYSGADRWNWQFVMVPFYQSDRVSVFGRDTSLIQERAPGLGAPVGGELPIPLIEVAETVLAPINTDQGESFIWASQTPQALPKNISGGVRTTATFRGTDVGLGAYLGWDQVPELFVDEDGLELLEIMVEDGQVFQDFDLGAFVERNPEAQGPLSGVGQRLAMGESLGELRYRRRATLLVDGARYVGPIGVRSDVAFNPQRVFYTTGFEAVQRASIFGVLGLSYERLLDGERPLSLTVEGFWLHPFDGQGRVHDWFVGEEASADEELVLVEDGYMGVASAVSWSTGWSDVELSAGGIASIRPGDVIGRIELEKPWRSEFRTAIGAQWFWGPDPAEELSAGGLWRNGDRIVLSARGRF